jgi:hypothetical protein
MWCAAMSFMLFVPAIGAEGASGWTASVTFVRIYRRRSRATAVCDQNFSGRSSGGVSELEHRRASLWPKTPVAHGAGPNVSYRGHPSPAMGTEEMPVEMPAPKKRDVASK